MLDATGNAISETRPEASQEDLYRNTGVRLPCEGIKERQNETGDRMILAVGPALPGCKCVIEWRSDIRSELAVNKANITFSKKR